MKCLLPLALALGLVTGPAAAANNGTNVLMIIADDLNDWVGYMRGEPGGGPPAAAGSFTPNLDALAARGVAFTRAYAPAPICTPSRAAFLGGLRPERTGVYDLNHDWEAAFKALKVVPITKQFMANGFDVFGYGKIYHPLGNVTSPYMRSLFTNYSAGSGGGGGTLNLNGLAAGADDWGWPTTADTDIEMKDFINTTAAINAIKKTHTRPFFIALGWKVPHLPMYQPRKYFDLFPLSASLEPPVLANDLADLPPPAVTLANNAGFQNGERLSFTRLQQAGLWPEYARAYLASVAFADAQLGRIMAALAASPSANNTIIVIFGDHGYRLGEKGLHKAALWERVNRVPFIFAGPGIAQGARVAAPVDLMALYPTLLALTGVPAPSSGLDGKSILPLLRNPAAAAPVPYARTAYWNGVQGPGGKAVQRVRGPRCALTVYADGSRELYDERADPNEWVNLAGKPSSCDVATLASYIPQTSRQPVGVYSGAALAAAAGLPEAPEE